MKPTFRGSSGTIRRRARPAAFSPQAKPKLAAYTHIVLNGSDRVAPPTVEDVLAETRQTYGGPLAMGEDLMAFEIGETVTVRRHEAPARSATPARVA